MDAILGDLLDVARTGLADLRTESTEQEARHDTLQDQGGHCNAPPVSQRGEDRDPDVAEHHGHHCRHAGNDAAQPQILEFVGIGERSFEEITGPVALPTRVIPVPHDAHEPVAPLRDGVETEAVSAHAFRETKGRS